MFDVKFPALSGTFRHNNSKRFSFSWPQGKIIFDAYWVIQLNDWGIRLDTIVVVERLEKTILKTPKQNGVLEKMNRKIKEKIKCMLSDAKLPKSLWAETMHTVVNLINFKEFGLGMMFFIST